MITKEQRADHQQWLIELTGTPTAAGCEDRVIAWVTAWAGRRRNVRLRRDAAGNLIISRTRAGSGSPAPKGPPILITAHLDHPAFVVRGVRDERTVELEFRGSVHDPYFEDAAVEIVDAAGTWLRATMVEFNPAARPYKRVVARLDRPASLSRGDVGRLALRGRGAKASTIDGGLLYAPACDDLAGVAAALAAFDELRKKRVARSVVVLLTRAEEVGFLGAIAACRNGSIPKRARLICLENSRSFADSPIGGGPILRVGDRVSVFDPELTNRLGILMQQYQRDRPEFRAQRKLMPGGMCEASTFCAYGYEATCVCLPLGNYHNMVDIDAVLAGKRPAKVAAEYIALSDYHGMIELLVHFARRLDAHATSPILDRMEALYRERGSLVER